MSRNNNAFWKKWRTFQGKSTPSPSIDGFVNENDIANHFANHYEGIYSGNDKISEELLRKRFNTKFEEMCAAQSYDSISNYFLSFDELSVALSKLKCKKASSTFVKTEHIYHGSPKLALHLQTFFNGCIQHSYVPQDFLTGVIVPIIKNTSGDICSVDNYRGVTLSSTFSHLFEHCLLGKIGHYLYSDNLQY